MYAYMHVHICMGMYVYADIYVNIIWIYLHKLPYQRKAFLHVTYHLQIRSHSARAAVPIRGAGGRTKRRR